MGPKGQYKAFTSPSVQAWIGFWRDQIPLGQGQQVSAHLPTHKVEPEVMRAFNELLVALGKQGWESAVRYGRQFFQHRFRRQRRKTQEHTEQRVSIPVNRQVRRMDRDIIAAHTHCERHKAELLASTLCGCFWCLRVFAPSEIEDDDWLDTYEPDDTALCPFCGVDSVIGDASGYPITASFLAAMKAYWMT